VASIAAMTLFLAGVAFVLPGTVAGAAAAAAPITSGVATHVAAVKQGVNVAATTAGVIWRALLEPILPYAFAVAALMCLACVAFGTALNHLVLERAWQR
jgi:hypothetical protein